MKLFTARFDGTLLAWAQRSVRMLFLVLVILVVSWLCGGSSSSSMAPSTVAFIGHRVICRSERTDGLREHRPDGPVHGHGDLFRRRHRERVGHCHVAGPLVGATVTSGGLVTAVTSGAVTIMATYEGKSGLAVVQISPTTPSRSSMSTTIDGTSWDASCLGMRSAPIQLFLPAG